MASPRPSRTVGWSVIANVVKAFLGSNYLAVPYAFAQSGYIFGLVGTIVISLCTFHCCKLIVKCKHTVVAKGQHHLLAHDELVEGYNDHDNRVVDVSEGNGHGQVSPSHSPHTEQDAIHNLDSDTTHNLDHDATHNLDHDATHNLYHDATHNHNLADGESLVGKAPHFTYGMIGEAAWGHAGKVAVDTALVVNQFGFCVGYIIFLAQTLQDIATGLDVPLRDDHVSVACVALPVTMILGLSHIRDVASLGWTSILANISIAAGALALTANALRHFDAGANDTRPYRFGTLPIFFGMMVASMEGIGTVIPIENSMGDMSFRFPFVLGVVMTLVVVFLCSFAMLQYFAFGEAGVPSIILQTLPLDSAEGVMVRCSMFVSILLSVPLQIYPVFEVAELQTARFVAKHSFNVFVVRYTIVLVATVIAVMMRNHFELVGSFIGNTGGVALSYILPAIFDVKLHADSLTRRQVVQNGLLVVFGLVGGAVGLYSTVLDLIEIADS